MEVTNISNNSLPLGGGNQLSYEELMKKFHNMEKKIQDQEKLIHELEKKTLPKTNTLKKHQKKPSMGTLEKGYDTLGKNVFSPTKLKNMKRQFGKELSQPKSEPNTPQKGSGKIANNRKCVLFRHPVIEITQTIQRDDFLTKLLNESIQIDDEDKENSLIISTPSYECGTLDYHTDIGQQSEESEYESCESSFTSENETSSFLSEAIITPKKVMVDYESDEYTDASDDESYCTETEEEESGTEVSSCESTPQKNSNSEDEQDCSPLKDNTTEQERVAAKFASFKRKRNFELLADNQKKVEEEKKKKKERDVGKKLSRHIHARSVESLVLSSGEDSSGEEVDEMDSPDTQLEKKMRKVNLGNERARRISRKINKKFKRKEGGLLKKILKIGFNISRRRKKEDEKLLSVDEFQHIPDQVEVVKKRIKSNKTESKVIY